MAKHGQVKVTIVGYYPVSDDELDAYEIDEFDVAKMAKIDEVEYHRRGDTKDIIDFFPDSRPTSVTFEAVDDSDVDPSC